MYRNGTFQHRRRARLQFLVFAAAQSDDVTQHNKLVPLEKNVRRKRKAVVPPPKVRRLYVEQVLAVLHLEFFVANLLSRKLRLQLGGNEQRGLNVLRRKLDFVEVY